MPNPSVVPAVHLPPAPEPTRHPSSATFSALPPELKERILAQVQGADAPKTMHEASVVHPDWLPYLRHAQPAFYRRKQQQLWMLEATGKALDAPSERSKAALTGLDALDFRGIGRKPGAEQTLRALDAQKLSQLTALVPGITRCTLQGLEDGPRLFARWAQHSLCFAKLTTLVLDATHVTMPRLQSLVQGAAHTPLLERILVNRPQSPVLPAHKFSSLNPRAPTLDLSCWPKLQELQISGCGVHLIKLHLKDNLCLSALGIAHNFDTDLMLFGDRGPASSMRSLTVSNTQWSPEAASAFAWAAFAATVVTLRFEPTTVPLTHLNLHGMGALERLTLTKQPVDYPTLTWPRGTLKEVWMGHTQYGGDNVCAPGAFALPHLTRLMMSRSALTGELNALGLNGAVALRVLDVRECALTDADVETWLLPEFSSLTHLDLSGNALTGRVWQALTRKRLHGLQHLGLHIKRSRNDNALIEAILAAGPIGALFPSLKTLFVATCGITWQQEDAFDGMLRDAHVTLRHVDLAYVTLDEPQPV